MELSYIGQNTSQIVYYDSYGQIYPPTNEYPDGYYYHIEPQDSVDLDGFFILIYFQLEEQDSKYSSFPSINPYFGFGFSFGLNNIQSEYPDPGLRRKKCNGSIWIQYQRCRKT